MIEVFTEAFRRNPFPIYRRLQSRFPLLHLPRPWNLWLLSDYDSVKRVLTDHDTFSSRLLAPESWLSFQDPPIHTQLRALVSAAFTPQATARLDASIREWSRVLLDRIAGRREADLAAEYSVPLPMRVIAELIGMPVDKWETYKRWSDAILALSYSVLSRSRARVERGFQAVTDEMRSAVASMMAQRRSRPAGDLLTQLMEAEIDGERLSLEQIVGTIQILLVGGQSTISDLINNAVLCFVEWPEQLKRLRAEPDVLPSAIEEVLRYRSPIQVLVRTPRRAVELHGKAIAAGSLLVLLIGAANRDPRRFVEPDRFEIARSPNPHVAFGHGIHFCFGAALSRLEARIALTDLLDRYEQFTPAVRGPWRPRPGLHVHGPDSLPLRL